MDWCVDGNTEKSGRDHKTDQLIIFPYSKRWLYNSGLDWCSMWYVSIISSNMANN